MISIPGWMDKSHLHESWEELNIWVKNIDVKNKLDAEYVLGHSMGSIFVLLNWKYNKNTKIILSNPVFPKRGFWQWAIRFIKFHRHEGLMNTMERLPLLIFLPFGFIKLLRLIRVNTLEIIKEMPPEKIVVLCGKNDHYFCDQEARKLFREMGIGVIEIEEAGHNWHKKFNEEIKKIVSGG